MSRSAVQDLITVVKDVLPDLFPDQQARVEFVLARAEREIADTERARQVLAAKMGAEFGRSELRLMLAEPES